MAVLGSVHFERGRYDGTWTGYTPRPVPLSDISDQELFPVLWRMSKLYAERRGAIGPGLLIPVANLLQPLGKEKAIAAMSEYEQREVSADAWLHSVVRVLFETRDGNFRIPRVGGMSRSPRRSSVDWPSFPVIIRDDIPFVLSRVTFLMGYPERVSQYAKEHSDRWRMRSEPVRPGADPFAAFNAATTSPEYLSSKMSDITGSEGYLDQVEAYRSLIKLVQPVLGLTDAQIAVRGPGSLPKDRSAFLDRNPIWDEASQTYIPQN